MALEKHINFFELEKACEKPGCPLCRIVADRAERYIDNMLFEHVADRGFRALHRASGGFCAEHSKNLVSFRDGLAVAILGRDILEDRIEHFKKHKAWKPKGECPVCIERGRIEKEYSGFLAEAKDKSAEVEELKKYFLASDGLCAPHYTRLQQEAKQIPSWLKTFQEEKFEKLLERVSQFIELSAYGRQEEFAKLSEEDKIVWKELAISLRGNAERNE
jgi:hypothetical protein